MIRGKTGWMAAAALVLCITGAAGIGHAGGAGSVRLVRGGPAGAEARGAAVQALHAIAPRLAVCWRGGAPGRVKVELTVARTGEVTRAAQVTRGAAAQCAAGILAVHALPRVQAGYRVTVELATRGAPGDASRAPGDADADAIQASLAPYRRQLDQCYRRQAARSPGLAGRVVLSFTIHPDGRLTSPKVASSTLGNDAAEGCLVGVIRAARVDKHTVAKPMGYSLALEFGGGARGGASPRPGRRGRVDVQPKKDGPLAADAISAVMTRRRAEFSACYDRFARKARTLAGRVVLRFTVRDDGTVRNVKIRETTLSHQGVERCLVKVGRTLKFPAERGRAPTRVHYPFVFAAR